MEVQLLGTGRSSEVQPPGAAFLVPPKLDLRQELHRSRVEGTSERGSVKHGAAKKGEPWTEEEHVAFLHGLQRLGKGQWKSIAKYYVPTRTATQVASHAQKHFLRVSGSTKRRSRFSAVEEATLATGPAPLLAAAAAPAPAAAGVATAAGLAPPPPLLAAGGAVGGGPPPAMREPVLGRPAAGAIALGVPLGTAPPWLPPPIGLQAPRLPILPVGPLGAGPASSPPSSIDSRATGSPAHNRSSASCPQQEQQQQGGSAPARARPLPPTTSRQQQLLRLLEMREQQHGYPGARPLSGPSAAPLLQPGPAETTPIWLGTPPPQAQQQHQQLQFGHAAAAPQQPRSQQGSPVKLKAEPEAVRPGPVGTLMPPLWGSVPEGLAMLAEAAACSDKGGGAGPPSSCGAPAETDSDTDTTGCERHTV